MRDLAVPKESRQHRESLICERLIDERLLPLKRFNGTARWKVVCIVEKRRDDLREQFRNGGKPARRFEVAAVFGLPEHKLPTLRGVAEIQPIDTFLKKR